MKIHDIINYETKILAIVPHPDDFEDYFGGTIMQLLDNGQVDPAKIFVTVATNGAKGGRDKFQEAAQLVALRKQEQSNSLARLQIPFENLRMWNFGDGELNSKDESLLEHIVANIRQVKPDIVFTHDPDTRILHLEAGDYYCHRDHRELGTAVLDGVYPFSRDLMFFPEHQQLGYPTHTTTKVLLCEPSIVNVKVNINDYLEKKVELMSMHTSQVDSAEEIRGYYQKMHALEGHYWEQFRYADFFN